MRSYFVFCLIMVMLLTAEGGFRVRRRRRSCTRVNCVWRTWSSWSACSVKCGNGLQTRTRTILTGPGCGGASCYGPYSETIPCSPPCTRGTPIDGRCQCPFPYTGQCCRDTIQENNCQNRFELDQPWRSTRHQNPSGEPCDSNVLMDYWYQFTSDAGTKMSVECVLAGSCGVQRPIWLNGVHPSTGDGIVTRQACTSGSTNGVTNCCESSLSIRIKNCGDYYIYSLPKLDACGSGFCAGEEIPCPEGTQSPNGYTPNCMANSPSLTTPPNLDLSEDIFGLTLECSFSFASFSNMTFDVQWFNGDTELADMSVTLTTERLAILTQQQLDDVFDDNQSVAIACRISAHFIYPDGSPKSPTSPILESNQVMLTV